MNNIFQQILNIGSEFACKVSTFTIAIENLIWCSANTFAGLLVKKTWKLLQSILLRIIITYEFKFGRPSEDNTFPSVRCASQELLQEKASREDPSFPSADQPGHKWWSRHICRWRARPETARKAFTMSPTPMISTFSLSSLKSAKKRNESYGLYFKNSSSEILHFQVISTKIVNYQN